MAKQTFNPYQNESDSIQLSDLTIECRLDRISLYGSIDLTLDKIGLQRAQELKKIIDQTVSVLEKSDLPDMVVLQPAETVKNPFL
jgi:hypothetical protein